MLSLLSLAVLSFSVPIRWSRGRAAVLDVFIAGDGALSYNVSMSAPMAPWLPSAPGPPRAFCGGHWRDFSVLQATAQWSFTHPLLGAADALSATYGATSTLSNRMSPCACCTSGLNLTFVHFSTKDALEFRTSFPGGMSNTGGAPQPPCSCCSMDVHPPTPGAGLTWGGHPPSRSSGECPIGEPHFRRPNMGPTPMLGQGRSSTYGGC